MEAALAGAAEPPLRYHPRDVVQLTQGRETGPGTLPGGQFDWGGRLPEGNGGARSSAQADRKPAAERNGRSRADCETDRSGRCESRP